MLDPNASKKAVFLDESSNVSAFCERPASDQDRIEWTEADLIRFDSETESLPQKARQAPKRGGLRLGSLEDELGDNDTNDELGETG